MAKKSSRKTPASNGVDQSTAGRSSPATSRLSTSRVVEPAFEPDYSYIKQDLRRIGILVGVIFAALIILYFVLPYIFPIYA